MKFLNLKYYIWIFLLNQIFINAQNSAPVVSNVDLQQRTDGSMLIDIYYDVYDADGDLMAISMKASSDSGATWNFSCNNVSGAIGTLIPSGTGKHIIWNISVEHPNFYSNKVMVEITADDGGPPCPGIPTVTFEGKIYYTVQIGSQCWLRENLDVGTMIQGSQDQTNNEIIEKYCYDNLESNCDTYGGLYQWNEAMLYSTTEGTRGICPPNWHIPTNAEMQTLKSAAGNDGNALKAIGQGDGDGAGTNTSGFSILLAGWRGWMGGYFTALNNYALLWTSNSVTTDLASLIILYSFSNNVNNFSIEKLNGYSVRCVMDYPSLKAPSNNSNSQSINPFLEWYASEGATTYTLQVSTNSSFTSLIYNQSGLTSTSQQISGLDYLTQYYWRVRATNSYGTSYWSTDWKFTTKTGVPEAPTLNSPVNNTTGHNINLILIWNVSERTTSYTLQVSTNSSFTSLIYNQSGLTSTSQQLSGLKYATRYYWRVIATNSYGSSNWSTTWNFTTISGDGGQICPDIPTVTYEGKTYNTVLIKGQCWLKENLNVGTRINSNQNQNNNTTIEKYCYYNNESYCDTYGGLYQWSEAMQYSITPGSQGICPPGWHIPTCAEFVILSNSVFGNGNRLKEIGQGIGNGAGTNTSGFSALLAGYRSHLGLQGLGTRTYFWSSSEYEYNSGMEAYSLYLENDNSLITYAGSFLKTSGFSVRCLKD